MRDAKKLKKKWVTDDYPVCIDKLKIVLKTMEEHSDEPPVLARAHVFYETLKNIPIHIDEDEWIVGAGSGMSGGLEIEAGFGIWNKDEIDSLREEGFFVAEDAEKELYELNKKYKPAGIQDSMRSYISGNPRMEAFMLSGMILPPWRHIEKKNVVTGGLARAGLGLSPGMQLMCIDYEGVMKKGLRAMVEECTEELSKIQFFSRKDMERRIELKSMKLCLEAMILYANRYAELALSLAAEEKDEERKQRLLKISQNCARVPAYSPRNFSEAMQMFWFLFLVVNPQATASMGRFDQYMYPYMKADKSAGILTDDEVLDYLVELRLKDMQLRNIGGKQVRLRQSGMAKWHNMTICGVKPDGSDGTNELSYLVLEALMRCPTPHHTITLRVAESTPEDILMKGIECQKRGLSMPAFVSDKSYISFFVQNGMDIKDARDYAMTGCLDGNIPGRTVCLECGMFVAPMMLNLYLNKGIDQKTGMRLGHDPGDLDRFESFDEFLDDFLGEMYFYMQVGAEKNNIEAAVTADVFPEPVKTALMRDGIKKGIDITKHPFEFDNGCVMNPVGLVNLGNSLYAIKELVYREKRLTLGRLGEILNSNWEGHEDLRQAFQNVAKYGDSIGEPDEMVGLLYEKWAEFAKKLPAVFGKYHKPTAISVTSHHPGGMLCGATPDGRKAGETLADGCASPAQGDGTGGPLCVFKSALHIPQDEYQAMLLNMKFHPSALSSESDMRKLVQAVKIYFANGGKHVQFIVSDSETLKKAKQSPKEYQDLMVRVAGYSTYFVKLSEAIQDEIIKRTEYVQV